MQPVPGSNPVPPAPGGANPAPVQGPWTHNVVDGKGTSTCRMTVGNKAYIVTVRFSLEELGKRGYDTSAIDKAIEKVVEATKDQFPNLAGSSLAFDPEKPTDTIVTSHTTHDFSGKKISQLDQTKNPELFNAITVISKQFQMHFSKLPVQLQVEEDKGNKDSPPKSAPVPAAHAPTVTVESDPGALRFQLVDEVDDKTDAPKTSTSISVVNDNNKVADNPLQAVEPELENEDI